MILRFTRKLIADYYKIVGCPRKNGHKFSTQEHNQFIGQKYVNICVNFYSKNLQGILRHILKIGKQHFKLRHKLLHYVYAKYTYWTLIRYNQFENLSPHMLNRYICDLRGRVVGGVSHQAVS